MKGTNGCADKWRSRLINPVLGKEFTLRMRTVRSMWALFFYLLAIGLLALGYLYVTRMRAAARMRSIRMRAGSCLYSSASCSSD